MPQYQYNPVAHEYFVCKEVPLAPYLANGKMAEYVENFLTSKRMQEFQF